MPGMRAIVLAVGLALVGLGCAEEETREEICHRTCVAAGYDTGVFCPCPEPVEGEVCQCGSGVGACVNAECATPPR